MSKVASARLSRGVEYCHYCGGRLGDLGYYFTCHTCGENYCYIHMQKHNWAHTAGDGKAPLSLAE